MKTRNLALAPLLLGSFVVWIAACAKQSGGEDLPDTSSGPNSDHAGSNGSASGGSGGAFVPSGGSPSATFAGAPGASGAFSAGAGSTGLGGTTFGSSGAPAQAHAGGPSSAGAPASGGCVVAAGTATDLLIDDLEDGDNAIRPLGMRAGFWYTYNDANAATQMPAPSAMFIPDMTGGHGGMSSAHTSGPAFTVYGAGMGFDFNNTARKSCPYNAAVYKGITFWAKGNAPIKAMVKTSATSAVASGGTCTATAMCDDHYFVTATLTASWAQYTIDFAATTFKQGGWGAMAPFDKTTLLGVQFQVDKGTPFEFWVDDVTFF